MTLSALAAHETSGKANSDLEGDHTPYSPETRRQGRAGAPAGHKVPGLGRGYGTTGADERGRRE